MIHKMDHRFLHPNPRARAKTPEDALSVLLNALQQRRRANRNTWQAEFGKTLLTRHLESLESDFVKLMRGERVARMDVSRRDMIVSLFYGLVYDSYIGVDSHKPSVFFDAYPTLLQHLSSDELPFGGEKHDETTECHGFHTVRILPIKQSDLEKDAKDNDPRWDTYMDRHRKHDIVLLQVDPDVAKDALTARIGTDGAWTTDIGVWMHTCALLFEEPSRVDTRALQLVRRGEETWTPYLKYLSDLLKSSWAVEYRGSGIVEFEELSETRKEDLRWGLFGMFEELPLAERWEDFVDPAKREASMGEFLEQLVQSAREARPGTARKKLRVLDAAAGVGPESLWLMEHHANEVTVWSNEIDWTLAARFEERAESMDRKLQLSMYDWRHMASKISEEGVKEFDLVLALGNSLTCLLEVTEMERCLENFFQIMAPGALLAVDERNFRKISDRTRFDYRHEFIPSAVVYCGDIKAKVDYPGRLGRENMVLAYFEADAKIDDEPIGRFTVFPFRKGQLKELIEGAGFRVVDCYSDLVKKRDADAWFFTYVARKPVPGEDKIAANADGIGTTPASAQNQDAVIEAAKSREQPWDH
jgi:hypothetical protein